MKLGQLFKETNLLVQGNYPRDLDIEAVTDNSRNCGERTLFVAIHGTRLDGHDFLEEVAARGTKVALIDRIGVKAPAELSLIMVDNTRRALALIAQKLAGDPSRAMTVVGVTGTKGKTTLTWLLESIFHAAGLKSGVLGTINYRWDGHMEVAHAPQTTPSPMELAAYLAKMKADGVQVVAMEVSSHAIDQCRVDGITFAAGALTNVTRDHLDYHLTLEQYTRAKERLFTDVLPLNPNGVAVLNLDDEAGRRFAHSTRAGQIFGYSLFRPEAQLHVTRITFKPGGLHIEANALGRPIVFEAPLFGIFNAFNCLTAAAISLAIGIDAQAIREGLAKVPGVPGRFEFIDAGQPYPIIVDYAHTPDSLTQVLLNARGFARRRLIAVFGCGGDRDAGKRPLMGQAAARLADVVIVTNDNPRTEDPAKIAEAIVEGVKTGIVGNVKWHLQLDRRAAIREAIAMARAGDVVMIAGKGHEDYQILGSTRIHFDDREEARAAVNEKLQITNSKL